MLLVLQPIAVRFLVCFSSLQAYGSSENISVLVVKFGCDDLEEPHPVIKGWDRDSEAETNSLASDEYSITSSLRSIQSLDSVSFKLCSLQKLCSLLLMNSKLLFVVFSLFSVLQDILDIFYHTTDNSKYIVLSIIFKNLSNQ